MVLFLYFFGWIDFSKVIVKLVKCQKMFCNKSCLLEKSKNNGKDEIVYGATKNLIVRSIIFKLSAFSSCVLLVVQI